MPINTMIGMASEFGQSVAAPFNASLGGPAIPISSLASSLIDQVQQVVGPIITQGYSSLRANYLNFNDLAVGRQLQYRLNRSSTILNPAKPLLFGPTRLSSSQLLTLFNQLPWHRFDGDAAAQFALWRELEDELRWLGIRLDLPANAPAEIGSLNDWTRLIEFGSSPASLGQVIKDFYRGLVTQDELNFNLQRAGYRRKPDRDRVLTPGFNWNAQDVMRLGDGGQLGADEYDGLLKSAGFVNQDDRLKVHALAAPLDPETIMTLLRRGDIDEAEAHRRLALAGVTNQFSRDTIIRLRWRLPPEPEFVSGAVRRLWDEVIAERYGLDAGLADSPLAVFFARRAGTAEEYPALPGQPAGTTDWLKLSYRSKRPMPEFGLAVQMQHRLRPEEGSTDTSAVAGSPPWTADNTRDMLRVHGYSEPIIDRLIGLVDQPINIRLINHILGPYSTHPEVRTAAEEAFGPGVNWIEKAMLDHGFSAAYARVAAVGIQAQADDRDMAEKKEHEKRLRAANRDSYLYQYELGLAGENETVAGMTDRFFNADMARQEIAIVKAKLDAQVKKSALKALQEAWVTGKMTATDIRSFLDQLGFTSEAKERYIGEWTWERTEKTKMLSTSEILSALRDGLIASPIAQSRLVNLGWSAPDALVEIAQVQHGLQMAQAKSAAATATHQAVLAQKAHAELMKEEKANATATAAAYKKNLATVKQVQRAAHERLLATSEYYAKVHSNNSAYAAAEKAGNEERMASELDQNIAAYQKYLLDQIKLVQEGPEVANVIEPLDTHIAPEPKPSAGAGTPTGADATATPATPNATSGAG